MNLPTLKMILLSCVVSLTACNTAHDGTANRVFEKSSPLSREYKNELATKLRANPEGLHFTFNKLVEKDGKKFLGIAIKGEDFEATGLVFVNNWSKLEGIKKTNGLGYSGAELRGLKLKVEESTSGANLIYDDLEKIVD